MNRIYVSFDDFFSIDSDMEYTYQPQEESLSEPECENEHETESIDDFETSIQELDKIEKINENSIPNPDTEAQHFPDILKNPLLVKTVPEHVPEPDPRPADHNKYSILGFIRFIIMAYIGIMEDLFILEEFTIAALKTIFTKQDRLSALGVSLAFAYTTYLITK